MDPKSLTFLHFSVDDVQEPEVGLVEQLIRHQLRDHQEPVLFVEQPLASVQPRVVEGEPEVSVGRRADLGQGRRGRKGADPLVHRLRIGDPVGQGKRGVPGIRRRHFLLEVVLLVFLFLL